MALPVVEREAFLSIVRSAIERAAVDIDWAGLLTTYDWRGADWRAGLASRESMHRRLIDAASASERSSAVAKIVDWGGLPPLPADAVAGVLASFPLLDFLAVNAQAPLAEFYAERIASVSKVYAMYSPSQWIIYDSRVARGLALLALDLFYGGPMPSVFRFPQPQGRTGDPAIGFPVLGSARQAGLAFVYASWFARELAARLTVRCPDPTGWDLRHIEMALFMLGKSARAAGEDLPLCGIDRIVEAIDRRLGELSTERMLLEAARRALAS